MTQYLRDLVRQYNPKIPLGVPVMHTTKIKIFLSMVSQGKISTDSDPTSPFPEKLLYLFYGRPAYRARRGPTENKQAIAPTCLVLSFGALQDPKRIYPFDTGAYARYAAKIPNFLELTDFELYNRKENIKKFALLFFGDVRNYVVGGFCDKTGLAAHLSTCPAAQQFVELRDRASDPDSQYDDRAFTIELQSDVTLDLNESTVEAVVLPQQYLDCAVNGKTVETWIEEEWKAEVLPYRGYEYVEPEQYHIHIVDIVLKYIERLGDVPSSAT